jgi:hypothetical protein
MQTNLDGADYRGERPVGEPPGDPAMARQSTSAFSNPAPRAVPTDPDDLSLYCRQLLTELSDKQQLIDKLTSGWNGRWGPCGQTAIPPLARLRLANVGIRDHVPHLF